MTNKIIIVACGLLVLMSCKNNSTGTEQLGNDAPSFYQASQENSQTGETASSAVTDKGKVTMMEIPAPQRDVPEQILKRKSYTVSYNKDTRCPNWVAWHLTKAHTYGRHQRQQEVFTEDMSVATPRATDNDYYNSRYDRGHMCPAGDNKWDATAMSQSFLFTNVCPQNHGLNKYEWNDVEMLCRDWAQKYGAIDIVCGPLYDKTAEPKTIGKNKVRVPERFFKVVLCRGDRPKAIGFIYHNIGKKQEMAGAVRTVDEVERLTGFDFFPALADDVEKRVEASANLKEW